MNFSGQNTFDVTIASERQELQRKVWIQWEIQDPS